MKRVPAMAHWMLGINDEYVHIFEIGNPPVPGMSIHLKKVAFGTRGVGAVSLMIVVGASPFSKQSAVAIPARPVTDGHRIITEFAGNTDTTVFAGTQTG